MWISKAKFKRLTEEHRQLDVRYLELAGIYWKIYDDYLAAEQKYQVAEQNYKNTLEDFAALATEHEELKAEYWRLQDQRKKFNLRKFASPLKSPEL